MKTTVLLLFCYFCLATVQAQDIIFKTSGDQLKAKVTEIRDSDILYQYPDSLASASLSLPKTDVFMIQYANGTTELIKLTVPTDTLGNIVKSPQELYLQGRRDARRYYKGRGVFWGSVAAGATSLFTGGVTLAVPVVLAATPPTAATTRVPDAKLAQNYDYMKGYKKQAHRRKVGKAAAGTGTGILTGVAVVMAIVVAIFI